jgi:endonuclease/exonuclease/phosphatase family metal-dependent hydrolase
MTAAKRFKKSKALWPVLLCLMGLTGTGLGVLGVYIPPVNSAIWALFGLAFPFSSGLLMLGTAGAWVTRRWTWGTVGLLTLAVCLPQVTSTWGGLSSPQIEAMDGGRELRVLTWNVRQFNRYAWIERADVRDSMLAYLASQEADVICLQECFLEDRRNPWMSADRLKKSTGLSHWQEEFKLGRGHDKLFGLAVLSRYPILNKQAIRFDNDKNNSAMFVDLLINGDTVRLFNLHLSSIGFEKEDYEAARNVGDEANRSRLFTRLSNAWNKRALQAEAVGEAVLASPHPTVVAGDFNDTPTSYASQQMRRELNDAFAVVRPKNSSFLGSTYIGDLPLLRIDQIWASEELHVRQYITGDVELSDHRPVCAVFELASPED